MGMGLYNMYYASRVGMGLYNMYYASHSALSFSAVFVNIFETVFIYSNMVKIRSDKNLEIHIFYQLIVIAIHTTA